MNKPEIQAPVEQASNTRCVLKINGVMCGHPRYDAIHHPNNPDGHPWHSPNCSGCWGQTVTHTCERLAAVEQAHLCEVCGSPVRVVTSSEGTSYYERMTTNDGNWPSADERGRVGGDVDGKCRERERDERPEYPTLAPACETRRSGSNQEENARKCERCGRGLGHGPPPLCNICRLTESSGKQEGSDEMGRIARNLRMVADHFDGDAIVFADAESVAEMRADADLLDRIGVLDKEAIRSEVGRIVERLANELRPAWRDESHRYLDLCSAVDAIAALCIRGTLATLTRYL